MSTVTIGQVRALVDTDLEDADLQAVIDRQESWLASQVGPLTGPRAETFYPSAVPDASHGVVPLRRHVSSLANVAVTDAGAAISDSALRLSPDGWYITRPLYRWTGAVVTTYTPDDEAAVVEAVIDLVRLTITDSGYASEQIGSYGYSKGGGQRSKRLQRRAIVRSLLRPGNARTIRVQGARRDDGLLPLA